MIPVNPKRLHTEAMVVYALSKKIDELNIPFSLEYVIRKDNKKLSRGARFDIVILNNDSSYIIAIIEVKKGIEPGLDINKLSQTKRYKKFFDAPVYLCRGFKEIDITIQDILDLIHRQNET